MMEYRRVSVVRLAGSASLIHRNLCVARGLHSEGSISYAVAHKATANIVHVAEGASTQQEAIDYETTKDKDTMAFLTQVKWCHLKNQRTVLVLTSYKGFQILEWSSKNELYMNKFETPPGSFVCRFTRGVATIGDLVCVGTSDGPILMLNVPAQGSSVTITRQLKGHTVPITDLATNSEGHLASCDESGCIMVWQDPLTSDESSLVIEDAGEVPCMCLCFWENLLIGGFTNGQIVIYNSDSGAKAIEIGAHARSITSLDVAPDSGLLLSVSEDGTASVWRLEPGSDIKVTHLFSVTTTNTLLCGGQFCDAEGSEFALTGYDSAQVVLYSSSRKPPSQPTD